MEYFNKKYLMVSVLVFILVLIGWVYLLVGARNLIKEEVVLSDPFNITYVIGGETFSLTNGKAEKEYLPNSIVQNRLSIFGAPVFGDLDGDGDLDAAVLLENDPGGSGTFYYAALAINNDGVFKATETMFLGDRISPQTVEIHEGRAVYNIVERLPDEPMSAQPSVGKSIWVHYDSSTNEIGEWVKDFEGESNIDTSNKINLDNV